MFDGACSVMHVVPARQQVQNRAIPLKSDVMTLLSLMTGKRGEKIEKDKKRLIGCAGDKSIMNSQIRKRGWWRRPIGVMRWGERDKCGGREEIPSRRVSVSVNQQALNAL